MSTESQEKSWSTTKNALAILDKPLIRFIGKGMFVGLVTGLFISLFRIAVSTSTHSIKQAYIYMQDHPGWIPIAVIISLLLAWSVGRLVKSDPMIKGSGIPQVEGQLVNALHMNWASVFIKKFIGGILAIGSGLFLGREGPSIQLGASLGQGVNQLFRGNNVEEKFLITCGASAGLSAAFNAPFAGVIFALEEIHRNFSPIILLTAMAASVTADFVSSQFFGLAPVLSFGTITPLPLHTYGFLILLGVVMGIAGMIYSRALLLTQDIYKRLTWIPSHFHGVIPFLLVIPIGLLAPHLLGGGHEIIVLLSSKPYGLIGLIIVLLIRFIFSMICYGSGLPGGIFLPMLALGSIIGAICGYGFINFMGLDPVFWNNLIILSMAGFFTAVVKAPITGSMLIVEMTGSFATLLPVILVSLTAYIVSDLLHTKPIYEQLLHRMIPAHTQSASQTDKEILHIPIIVGSPVEGKLIRDCVWPAACLLISVKRMGYELLPKGDTRIHSGDELIILTNAHAMVHVKEQLDTICCPSDW